MKRNLKTARIFQTMSEKWAILAAGPLDKERQITEVVHWNRLIEAKIRKIIG
jgi:hypothetical protein